MPQRNLNHPAYVVWQFCKDVHDQLPRNACFLDNNKIIQAVESNDPARVAELANNFIRKICKSIPLFKKSRSEMKIDDNYTFYLDLDKKIAENKIVTLQLALWSCASSKCYRYISAVLIRHLSDKNVEEEISWSWMKCLVQCVSCSSKFVYLHSSGDYQKQYPACQVLSLVKSLFNISSFLIGLTTEPSFLQKHLQGLPSSFKEYCQQKSKENIAEGGHALEYFLDYQDDTFTLSKFLSSCKLKKKRANVLVESNSPNIPIEYRGNKKESSYNLPKGLGLLSNVADTMSHSKKEESLVTQNKVAESLVIEDKMEETFVTNTQKLTRTDEEVPDENSEKLIIHKDLASIVPRRVNSPEDRIKRCMIFPHKANSPKEKKKD